MRGIRLLRLEKINVKMYGIFSRWLSYEPENETARRLYREYGFEETGEMDGEEVIAVLRLQDLPSTSGA